MKEAVKHKGFSLAEILMAIGILSVGMLLIAAVFPAGIHFTTISTERTIAAAAADEAFAKIRMFMDVNVPVGIGTELSLFPAFDPCIPEISGLNITEFIYPSAPGIGISEGIYFWSAVWRRIETDPTGRSAQVTVFVSRKVRTGAAYYELLSDGTVVPDGEWPMALPVNILSGSNEYEIIINEPSNSPKRNFISSGYTIVDGGNGWIYRVLERDAVNTDIIILDKPRFGGGSRVWVVPAPVGGGRYPCIAVYQKVIRF